VGNNLQALIVMSKSITGILFFINICSASYCQKAEPINTDRPDQSDGTYTLTKKTFQLETGLLYGKTGENYFAHTNMLRYGVSSSTEVRLLFTYGKRGGETGIVPPGISVKQHLVTQKKWIPEITAVGYIRLPFLATNNFKTKNPAATYLLAFQNDITDHFSIGYNLGTTFDGDNTYENWIVTTSLGYSATKKLSFFAEYFSSFAKITGPNNNIDVGALWLINTYFQIDIALGSTIGVQDKNQFVTTGISYRFK
jgi:hypothetical protein